VEQDKPRPDQPAESSTNENSQTTEIYSAGTTFMSFFARDNRYLTRGTRLMIHERKLSKTLQIDGPLTNGVATVKATLNESKRRLPFKTRVWRTSSEGRT
jgi:hypothetical protein